MLIFPEALELREDCEGDLTNRLDGSVVNVNKINRLVFGGVIGLMAGFSFHLAVLPFVAESIFPNALGDLYASMNPATFWLLAVWMTAGAAAAQVGGAHRGSLIFGAGGLVAATLFGLGMVAGGDNWPAPLICALTGALYGGGAGLLVGAGFGPITEG